MFTIYSLGVSEVEVSSAEELLLLMKMGISTRTTGRFQACEILKNKNLFAGRCWSYTGLHHDSLDNRRTFFCRVFITLRTVHMLSLSNGLIQPKPSNTSSINPTGNLAVYLL